MLSADSRAFEDLQRDALSQGTEEGREGRGAGEGWQGRGGGG